MRIEIKKRTFNTDNEIKETLTSIIQPAETKLYFKKCELKQEQLAYLQTLGLKKICFNKCAITVENENTDLKNSYPHFQFTQCKFPQLPLKKIRDTKPPARDVTSFFTSLDFEQVGPYLVPIEKRKEYCREEDDPQSTRKYLEARRSRSEESQAIPELNETSETIITSKIGKVEMKK